VPQIGDPMIRVLKMISPVALGAIAITVFFHVGADGPAQADAPHVLQYAHRTAEAAGAPLLAEATVAPQPVIVLPPVPTTVATPPPAPVDPDVSQIAKLW